MSLRPFLIGFSAAILALSISIPAHPSPHSSPEQDSVKPKAATFTADIAPLLAAKCQPCHFKGGKVFDRLPFDQYKTVAKVASRLNTRLKDKDAELVARWIEEGTPE